MIETIENIFWIYSGLNLIFVIPQACCHTTQNSENLYEPVTLARQNTLPEDGSLRTETCRSFNEFYKKFLKC